MEAAMRRTCVVLLLLLLWVCARAPQAKSLPAGTSAPPGRSDEAPPRPAPAKERPADLDLDRARETLSREIRQILKETGIPSISIALLKDDAILWTGAFGYSHLKLKVPATPRTIYSTGSCFKSVTALAAMQLVERGKLKLDAPVNDYLGEFRIKDRSSEGQPVTLRHLLSHHSGLRAGDETAASNAKT